MLRTITLHDKAGLAKMNLEEVLDLQDRRPMDYLDWEFEGLYIRDRINELCPHTETTDYHDETGRSRICKVCGTDVEDLPD